ERRAGNAGEGGVLVDFGLSQGSQAGAQQPDGAQEKVARRRRERRAGNAGEGGVLVDFGLSQGSQAGAQQPDGDLFKEGCPSGQREQAVNLPAYAYVGSNPTPSTARFGRRATHSIRRESSG